MTATIGSHAWKTPPEVEKASGTRFDFSITSNCGVYRPWLGVQCSIASVGLTIDGDPIGLPSVPANSQTYDKGVRFSTTHFSNGVKRIQLHVVFHVTDQQGTRDEALDPYVDLDMYNRAMLTGTDANYAPPLFGAWDSVSAMSKKMAQSAALRLNEPASPLHHIGFVGDWSLLKTEQEPKFREQTVYFAATHGTPDGFFDGDDPGTFMNWSYIAQQVATRTVPIYNMVFLYSCNTLTGTNAGPQAFGINLMPGSNQAYFGFENEVLSWLAPYDRRPEITVLDLITIDPDTGLPVPKGKLTNHVSRVFDLLAGGKIASNCLNYHSTENPQVWMNDAATGANYAFPPRTSPNEQGKLILVDMTRRGDERARLGSVYRTASEETAYPGDGIWNFVYDRVSQG